MIHHIALTLPGRAVEFDMDFDPGNIADVSTKLTLEQHGCCEPEVAHVMNRVLREGDLFVDVGANIGFFTLLASCMVGNTGQVLVFEPGGNVTHKLAANIALNRLPNARVYYRALWCEPTEMVLHLAEDSGLNSLAAGDETVGTSKLETEVLDAYCHEQQPRMIKLDVEGAEEQVLRGAQAILDRGVSYVCCEMNQPALRRMGSSQRSLRQFMTENGYQMFVPQPSGIIPVLIPSGTEIVSERQNLNVLFSTVVDVGLAWPTVGIDKA